MMDDLISRSAAIAELMKMVEQHMTESARGDYLHYTGVKAMLEYIPAVDAVPVVHAHWVEEPDRVNHWHCSNCGCTVGLASLAYRYCYVCGAKMDGERRGKDGE